MDLNSTTLFLIIGTALLVSGLALAGFSAFSVAKQFLTGAALLNGTSLQPGMAVGAVMKNVPPGQHLAFSISENPSNIPLKIRILDPNGTALATYDNITGTAFESRSIETAVAGDHTLEVTNLGSKDVVVTGAMINSPIGKLNSTSGTLPVQNIVTFGIGILAGIALIIAGIVMLIIGAIKYAKGRRHVPSPSGPAT